MYFLFCFVLSLFEVNKVEDEVDNWCSFKNKLELYSKEMVFSSITVYKLQSANLTCKSKSVFLYCMPQQPKKSMLQQNFCHKPKINILKGVRNGIDFVHACI